MGPLSRFRLRLTALLIMLPRTALAQNPYSGGVDVAVALFLTCVALVPYRRLVGSASGMVMARLAIAVSGEAAAGGVPHARPAAASALSRGKAVGTGRGS